MPDPQLEGSKVSHSGILFSLTLRRTFYDFLTVTGSSASNASTFLKRTVLTGFNFHFYCLAFVREGKWQPKFLMTILLSFQIAALKTLIPATHSPSRFAVLTDVDVYCNLTYSKYCVSISCYCFGIINIQMLNVIKGSIKGPFTVTS